MRNLLLKQLERAAKAAEEKEEPITLTPFENAESVLGRFIGRSSKTIYSGCKAFRIARLRCIQSTAPAARTTGESENHNATALTVIIDT